MTTPEENTPKTRDTDQVLPRPQDRDQEPPEARPTLGAELADKMKENNVNREDLTRE